MIIRMFWMMVFLGAAGVILGLWTDSDTILFGCGRALLGGIVTFGIGWILSGLFI